MYCNLLINKLPQHTDSGLRIRTDFRESIKFELLMQDRTISDNKKIRMVLNLYYYRPEQIEDLKKALEEIVWFYKGGDKIETKNSKEKQFEIKATETVSKYLEKNISKDDFEYRYNGLEKLDYFTKKGQIGTVDILLNDEIIDTLPVIYSGGLTFSIISFIIDNILIVLALIIILVIIIKLKNKSRKKKLKLKKL